MRLRDLVDTARSVLNEQGPQAAVDALEPCRKHFGEITFRYVSAPFQFCAGHHDDAFRGLHYRGLFDHSVAPFRRLPLWDGGEVGGRTLIWAPPGIGIGAEIMHFGFLAGLASSIDLEIACDDRLVPRLRITYPKIRFHERSAVNPEMLKQFVAQASILSLGFLTKQRTRCYKRAKRTLPVSSQMVSALRLRYIGEGARKPLVGISWKTTNPKAQARNIVLSDLFFGLPEADQPAQLSLQHGVTAVERKAAMATGMIIDESIDPIGDFNGLVHQIATCDIVVTCANSVAHIAGSLGKKTYLLLSKEPTWEWWAPGSENFWYSSVTSYRLESQNQQKSVKTAIFEELRRLTAAYQSSAMVVPV